MQQTLLSNIRIGLVGAGEFCRKILQKTTLEFDEEGMRAHIAAVSDPDPKATGMLLAAELGLTTLTDHHDLYLPEHQIDLIILLSADPNLLNNILETKPGHIRLISYQTFLLVWKAIAAEEDKLRKRNREIQTILDGIADFILVITPDHEIVEANEAFLKQMGYSRDEVIGKKCHQIFQKLNRMCDVEVTCPLEEAIHNRRRSESVLTRIDRRGNLRYIEVIIYPVWESPGKISKFIEISRDITQRVKAEEEITRRLEKMVEKRTRQLRETQDKLIHQDKMASLGKLSASVVHEINNPVAGILTLNLLMQRIVSEGDLTGKTLQQFSTYLHLMETETRRVSRIVSNLLGFSRQSNMELKKFNLHRLIEKTLFLNQNLLKISRVHVEKNLAADLPEIVGSQDLLQQVFVNMISNAAEAMRPAGGGILKISTQPAGEQAVRIVFEDTGSGIPKENRPHLFEPFFTTKKKGKGVGLGLSVAYGIVEEHGGHIEIESREDIGTVVRIELPVKPTVHNPGERRGQHKNSDR